MKVLWDTLQSSTSLPLLFLQFRAPPLLFFFSFIKASSSSFLSKAHAWWWSSFFHGLFSIGWCLPSPLLLCLPLHLHGEKSPLKDLIEAQRSSLHRSSTSKLPSGSNIYVIEFCVWFKTRPILWKYQWVDCEKSSKHWGWSTKPKIIASIFTIVVQNFLINTCIKILENKLGRFTFIFWAFPNKKTKQKRRKNACNQVQDSCHNKKWFFLKASEWRIITAIGNHGFEFTQRTPLYLS